MEIKKVNDTFNMYTIKLSYGELTAMRNALQSSHGEPVADEMSQAIEWYMNENLPGPGEDKKDKEEEKEEAMPLPDSAEELDKTLPAPPAEVEKTEEPEAEESEKPEAGIAPRLPRPKGLHVHANETELSGQ